MSWGRIVLPIELRRSLSIDIKDPMEIFVDGESIMMKKYNPACIICGETGELVEYKGKKIYRSCIKEMR